MKKILAFLLTIFVTSLPQALAATPSALYDAFGHPIGATFSGGNWYLNTNGILAEVATGATGAAAPALDKVIAGLDGGSLIRPLLTDTSGRLQVTSVNGSVGATGAAVPSSATFMGVQSGANLVGLSYGQAVMAASLPVTISSDQSALNINNISGTVSLPTGASTAANQATGNTSLASIDGKLTTTANGLKVDVQASALPAGASTSANQTTGNTSLASIDGKLGSLGQKIMTGSAPVVIASDQSAIPVSQSGTWNVNNISGTVSLPTGAATSALQTTGNTTLSAISGQLPVALDGSGFLKVHEQGTALTSASQNGVWSVRAQDGSGNALTSTAQALDVNLKTSSISVQTKAPINANAQFSQTSVTTTASTIIAPANAVRVLIQGDSSNTDCIRYRFDGTAATSAIGVVAQPGQDSGQLDSGMSVSVAACSGTQKVNVQYFAQ